MTDDASHQPDLNPHGPEGEPEDLLDLTLDEALDSDLQTLADEAASQYHTQAVPEMDLLELPQPSTGNGTRANLETALTEAETQMEDLLRRESELMDQQRRLAADFNNFRNRAQRDILLAVDQSERKILMEILPVLDNFERGLSATYQDVETFRGGVELIRKQFLEALRRLNVDALPIQVGEPFDALNAEALTTFTDPSLPDGAVVAIYERGFSLRGQLLRAARVVVNSLTPSEKS